MEVFQTGGGGGVDLMVAVEGAADLVLESAVDGWVAKNMVSDTAKGCRGGFASCCSVMMVSSLGHEIDRYTVLTQSLMRGPRAGCC